MNKYSTRFAAILISALCFLIPSLALASFNTNLSYGSSGSEVLSLQQFLTSEGLLPASDDTGNYFSLTQSAVQQFQSQHGIAPASGYFGPLTRAQANMMAGATVQSSSSGTGDASLIAQLQTQLQQLLTQIAALGGSTAAGVTVNTATTAGTSAEFTASPNSGSAPLSVTFNASGLTSIGSYMVNFGDGSTGSINIPACDPAGAGSCSSFSGTVAHTYSLAGTYPVSLTSPGGTVVGSATVTVSTNTSQSGSLNASPSSGSAPLTVTFTGSGLPTIGMYVLNFGDGSTGSINIPACDPSGAGSCSSFSGQTTHTYAASGTYTAILTSQAGSLLGSVSVTVGTTVTASSNLSATPTSGGAPLTVSFTVTPFTGSGTFSFGDGLSDSVTSVQPPCSSASTCYSRASDSHTYQNDGTYTASFTNSSGSVLGSETITVSGTSNNSNTQETTCGPTSSNCTP